MRFSASAVPRMLKCPASAVLDHHKYNTADAEAGVENHAEMEDAGDAGEIHKFPAEVQALIDPDATLETETAFVYNIATGESRKLGKVDRDYGQLGPFDIPGTLDLHVVSPRRLVIVDWKRFEDVEPAETNTQAATYALMAGRFYNRTDITIAISYLGAGKERTDIAEIGSLDLDAHAERLKRLHVDVARAAQDPEPFLNPGPHCKYCEAFMSCPRQKDLGIQLGNGVALLQVEAQLPFHDDESAAEAYEFMERVKLFYTRLRAALYARAGEKPIPLRGGGVLGPVIKQGHEKLDGDIVYAVLKERHGQAIADAAVIRSATKKRLKEALAFTGEAVAVEERAVLAQVRAQGGSKRETKTVIEVFDPHRTLKAVP